MAGLRISGSVRVLILYDTCEEIRLEELRRTLGVQPAGREPSFKHSAPEYVRFERPPVVVPLGRIILQTGERLEGQLKFYDYGVVSVEFELDFAGDWDMLVDLSSRYIAGLEIERHAADIAHEKLKAAGPALVKPYENWLVEDYYIFQVKEITGELDARALSETCGSEIAQIVRGEKIPLSEGERREVLQSSMSYYPSDLVVVGWNAAFVYDTPAGAETTIQLLEYANSQLLEFRHYDEVLTRQLRSVYQSLEHGTGLLGRWRQARASTRLNTLLLEVTELTERADNSIKFLSDMFSARLYGLAASKVGVPDYKRLVQEKLRTAENLYKFMVEQFHQARAFTLELMVVLILMVELVMLFRGKG